MPYLTSDECDELLKTAGNAVWRLIVRLLGNSDHDAADCFQQTFVEFIAKKRSSNVHDATGLLTRIATTRAVDVIRRRIRDRKRIHDVDPVHIRTPSEFETETEVQANELLDELRAALAELPLRQSTVFVMTQIDDVPHNEVAAAMGISASHVGVLLHRARGALRQRLHSHNPVREVRS